ncbi:MAG TPA: DUF1836 domain-containing protein [Anaerovoracaceae bacterium]|nr:DUF1836 domain-containing protein [Anaerovoracaceae bacterium]
MKELAELIEKLAAERPADWENLPDIELYRDQVLSYMKRQHSMQPDGAQLTGAMINNYIKSGLLPRTNGKKYTRDHLVYLTAICSLKQVLSVGETDELLKLQPSIADAKDFYEQYLEKMEKAFRETAERLDENDTKEQLAAAALELAISSYAQKLACEKILDLLKEKTPPVKERQNKKTGLK